MQDRDYSRWLYYYRVSSQGQEEHGNALDRYREQGLTLGIPPENTYFDVASGASQKRPEFKVVMHRLNTEANLDGLVTPYHSRLHRDEEIWVKIKGLLQKRSLGFIDLARGPHIIDLSSAEGEFSTGLDALLAQRQRREIQRHSIQGHIARRRKKKFATAPFGYIVTPERTLAPNNAEYRPGVSFWQAAQQIVRWLVEDDLNISGVANKQLEAWGDRTFHRDRPGTPPSLKGWVNNPALRGYFLNTITGEMTDMGHERLLTDEQHAQLQRKFRAPHASRGTPHPFSSLLFCTECGSRVVRKSTHRGAYVYLYCIGAKPAPGNPVAPTIADPSKPCPVKKLWRWEPVEEKVISMLIEHAAIIGQLVAEPENYVNPEIDELATAIMRLEALNDPDLQGAIEKKKTRLNALKQEIAPTTYDPEMARYYAQLASDPAFWAAATDTERGVLFRELISSGTLSPDGIVTLEFAFSS